MKRIKSDQANAPASVIDLDSAKPSTPRRGKGGDATQKQSTKLSVIAITLTSRQPMLQNALTEAALDNLPGGSGKLEMPNVKEMTGAQRCDLVRYHGPNNEFGVPSENLFAALVNAGRLVKFEGKRNLGNAELSMIPGFLTIQDDFLVFKNQDPQSWTVDKRRGVNPATGGAMCLVRPRFASWEVDVTVEIDHAGGIKLDQVRKLFETAGRESGLGDHRRKGSFGRFRVTKWVVTEKESETAEAA
jgi:hypothetical protein